VIFDTIDKAFAYKAAHPCFEQAFEYLSRFNPDTPNGKYEIEGENIFALVQRYSTLPEAEIQWETHRRYSDIQYVASGNEKILFTQSHNLQSLGPYNSDRDVEKYEKQGLGYSSVLIMTPKSFCIFEPGEAHKPSCSINPSERVTKVVIKCRF